MSTFVLVPGGFHGGWCYSRVARLLRAAGHEVYTPTLTGLGDRSHLLSEAVNLETHLQDIVNLILWEDLHDVVLGGHSYAGFVITGVADRLPDRIAALAYIDAVIPSDGEAVMDQTPKPAKDAVLASVVAHGGYVIPPFPSDSWVNAADRGWVDSKCTPHPLACLQQPIRLSGAYRKIGRRVFIYAVGWAEDGHYQKYAREPGCIVRGIEDTRHDIMLDQPQALAKVLVETST